MVETLKVGLGDRSYPLHIGAGVLDRLTADWSERLTPKRLSVVADARALSGVADGAQISSRSFKISGATKSAPTRSDRMAW